MYSSFSGLMNVGLKYSGNTSTPLVTSIYPPFTTTNASYSGTTTVSGINYKVAIFQYSSSLTMSFSTTQEDVDINIICVGGGGAGSAGGTYSGGGGGGGSVIVTKRMYANNAYTVTVGAGGAGRVNVVGLSGGVTRVTGFDYDIQADGGVGGVRNPGGQDSQGGKGHPFGINSNNIPNGGAGGDFVSGVTDGNGGDSTMNMYSTTGRPTFYHQNGSIVSITTVVPPDFNPANASPAVFTPSLAGNPFYLYYSGGGGGGSGSNGGGGGGRLNLTDNRFGRGGLYATNTNATGKTPLATSYGSGGGGAATSLLTSGAGVNGIVIIWAAYNKINYGVYTVSAPTTFVRLPQPLLDSTSGSFTIEYFIKNPVNNATYPDPGKIIVNLCNGADANTLGTNEFNLALSNQGVNRVQMFTANINRFTTQLTDFLGTTNTNSRWHHVAFVYAGDNNTNNHLYINGVHCENVPGWPSPSVPNKYENQVTNTASAGYRMPDSITTSKNLQILTNLEYTVDAPIYNLRITRGAVYTSGILDFTAPTTELSETFPSGSGLECIFCLESYKENNITYIRDKVSGTSFTGYLDLNTTASRF